MAIGYPAGRTVSYLRNTAGEIVAVTTALPGEPAHTVADGIVWEAFGPVQRLTHGNGVTALRHYDADGHLTQWDVSGLLNRTYVRDAAGRITEIYDADPSRSETYGYDDADRLSGAAGPYGARAWTYDAVGNRLSQDKDGQWSGYTYGGNSNRLGPYIPQIDLDSADIHVGEMPWYAPDWAGGITRGTDIYFADPSQTFCTPEDLAFLGHELVHVGQYRNGMTWYEYLWASRNGYDNNPYEVPAYALQRKIQSDLRSVDCSCRN